jgi:hypothetical protein
MRHRVPALLLGALESAGDGALACTSRRLAIWRWADMLEAGAQAAGLLAGLQQGGVANTAVVAEYRHVRVRADAHPGRLRIVARIERRLLHFWRCRIEVRSLDGEVLLDGTVTIAPGEHGTGAR